MPDTYHTAGSGGDRHLNFYGDRDNLRLGAFRAELHACFTRRADALFELGDALLCALAVASLPHLSLEPVCRRGWGSVYAALAHGRIDAERLRDLLASQLPDGGQPVFAVDVTTWPRCDAECSPQRGYYYHPSRHSAGQPIIAGWAWQWIAQVNFERDSWTAPVDARRLHPLDDTDQTAAAQIHALLERLPASGGRAAVRLRRRLRLRPAHLDLAEAPWRCWSGCAPTAASMLIHHLHHRARPAGRAATAPSSTAPTRPPGQTRPPPWQPSTKYGTVTVQAWAGLHPKQQRHPGHGSRGPRPIVRGTVIGVQVERVPAKTRPPKVLWLWWAGPGELDLDLVWRAYVRRFDLEHTVHFCKQTLGWTTPRPRHSEQADRWTWLVLACYAQLRLARPVASDQHLPWERPRPQLRRSPVRVHRGFPRLLARLGSPASGPKPAGRTPGRPKGRCSGSATRHPAIKKPVRKPRKKASATTKTT